MPDDPLQYSELIPRPDPTRLTSEAVEKATSQYRRELEQLRELIETRLNGMDHDRARLWERMRELPGQQETANNHFRDEVGRRDEAGRELIEQRLADLDRARVLTATQSQEIAEQQAIKAAG